MAILVFKAGVTLKPDPAGARLLGSLDRIARFSAADIVIFPSLQLLLRALARPEARDLSSRFLPLDVNYPALSRWIARVEALPGYEKTYPPHWRDSPS